MLAIRQALFAVERKVRAVLTIQLSDTGRPNIAPLAAQLAQAPPNIQIQERSRRASAPYPAVQSVSAAGKQTNTSAAPTNDTGILDKSSSSMPNSNTIRIAGVGSLSHFKK